MMTSMKSLNATTQPFDLGEDTFQPFDSRESALISDRYRLSKRVGDGGMGEVFLATDLRLGKPVALKRLKASIVTAKNFNLEERFERECAICAALKSQHVVQVSDYGITPEGYPFYVMEYLQGQTLEELLSTQIRLPVSTTCQIISQVCAGLQLAHAGVTLGNSETNNNERIKVIHRDLKPANIFLVPTGLGELVKIIDFGIAKIRSLSAEATNITQFFLGTSHYAAPEQFEIISAIDERADIYSLGMILYEMLTGVDPFGFNFRYQSVSRSAWRSAHLSQAPHPLQSQPDVQVTPELEAVVMRCLEKAPDDRFASVAALNQALQAACSGSPAHTSSQASASRFSPPPAEITKTLVTVTSLSPVEVTKTLVTGTNSDPAVEHTATSLSSRQRSFSSISWTQVWVGIGLATVLGIGAYSLPQISNLPFLPKVESAASAPSFSLASALADHAGTVWSVALSADGQTLVSGSEDNTIKVWDLKTGQVNHTLTGHTDSVRSLSLSPDGQTLASGGGDNTVKLWDVQTGALRYTLSGHSGTVWSVACDRTGQTLASGSEDHTIKLWDMQTGALRTTLSGHSAPVYSVALNDDGHTLASGSGDKTIKLWNAQTGELLHTLKGHSDAVRAVAFSPDGRQLASASWDNTIKIWNVRTGRLLHTLEGHRDRVVAIAFNADGRSIVSASTDRTIKIWDAQTGQLRQTLSGHSDWVVSLAISSSNNLLVSGSKDKTIKIWQQM